MKRFSPQLIAYLAIFLLCLSWLIFYQRLPALTEDTHCYTGLAQSLRVNGTYVFNFVPHTIYPPGFPVLLAGLSWLAGSLPLDSYPLFMRFIGFATALCILMGYILVRRHTSPWWGLAYVLLVGFSSSVVIASTRFIGSDVPYTLTSLAAVLLFEFVPSPPPERPGAKLIAIYVLLALLLPASLSIRAIGRAMLLALALQLMVSSIRTRRWPSLALVAVLLLGATEQAAWSFWAKAHTPRLAPGEYNYSYESDIWKKDPHHPDLGTATLVDLAVRPVVRMAQESSHFAQCFNGNRWITPLPYSMLVAVPAVLVITGWCCAILAPGAGFMPYYFLTYMGILLVWPFDQGIRYIFPVLPLFFIYAWTGWRHIRQWSADCPRKVRLGVIVLSAVMLVGGGLHHALVRSGGKQALFSVLLWGVCLALAARIPQWLGSLPARAAWVAVVYVGIVFASEMPTFVAMERENITLREADREHYPTLEVSRWLMQNSDPGSVIMTWDPWMVHAESGRRTVLFPPTANVNQILQVARSTSSSYLVILQDIWYEPSQQERLDLIQKAHPEVLTPVVLNKDFRVFRIHLNP